MLKKIMKLDFKRELERVPFFMSFGKSIIYLFFVPKAICGLGIGVM